MHVHGGDRDAQVEVEPEAAVETHAEKDNVDAVPALAPNKQAERLLRFKEMLKTLVREGTMSRDEARSAWVTRLKSIGVCNIR